MKICGITGNPFQDGVLTSEQQSDLDSAQLLSAHRVLAYLKYHGNKVPYPLVCMPTGFGKSRVIHNIIRLSGLFPILIIVGTKNIQVDQNGKVIKLFVEQEYEEKTVSVLPDTSGEIVLATWQGVAAYERKTWNIPHFGLIIIDEVHNVGTDIRLELLKVLAPQAVVGLTATEKRSTGNYLTPEEYGFHIVDNLTLPYCIEKQWLSPLLGLAIDTEVVLPQNVLNGGRINTRHLYRALRRHPELFSNIAQEIITRILPTGMKTLVVVNRIEEEACVMADMMRCNRYRVGLGINEAAAKAHSGNFITLGAEERYLLPPTHPQSLQVLISPQKIGEGFDAPPTECIVWASITDSLTRYIQFTGRGARRCPGKRFCLVVDFVYMIENYGYNLNFSHIFAENEMQDLGNGFMYVGSSLDQTPLTVPRRYVNGAKVVAMADLKPLSYLPADDWLTVIELTRILNLGRFVVESALTALKINSELRLTKTGYKQWHYPPESVELLRAWFKGK